MSGLEKRQKKHDIHISIYEGIEEVKVMWEIGLIVKHAGKKLVELLLTI